MPASPLDRQNNDQAVRQMAPLSPTDLRVPTAEEFDLDSRIAISLFRAGRSHHTWLDRPVFTSTAPSSITITGKLLQIGSPVPIDLNTTITVPPLANTVARVDRRDSLYLVGFTAEIGELQDPLLGQFSYGFPGGVRSIAKENTRRYRYYWVLFYRMDSLELSSSDVILAIGNTKQLPIANQLPAGFSRAGYQIFALDSRLSAGKSYKILTDTIDISPILAIDRRQKLTLDGYSYGLDGEVFAFDAISHLDDLAADEYARSIDTIGQQRLQDIATGVCGKLSVYQRSILNLSVGASGNPAALGIGALSLNGSNATANDQRISFTNQAIVETRQAYPVTVALSAGNVLIATGLNTNAPPGSIFSGDKTLHKIYKADGTEQSQYGIWSNLAGTGGLQWLGTSNSTLVEGETAYVVPAVDYPAGSGFGLPFSQVEKIWHNAVEIGSANVRIGWEQDLSDYETPAGGEDYILVFGSERAALHYIYRKITLTIGVSGVAVLPTGMTGCLAFIEGVAGRIDSPVRTGLAPGTRNALIYHAPRSTDSWQIQFRAAQYQGLGSAATVNLASATIAGTPIAYAHAQGAGGSVFQGEFATRYAPIALHLPSTETGIPCYTLDTPIQLAGEEYRGPASWREIELMPGTAGVLPAMGQSIKLVPLSGTYPRSIAATATGDDEILGCYAPVLASGKAYQLVVMMPIVANDLYYMLIATKNTLGGESISFDPGTGVAIDIFYSY